MGVTKGTKTKRPMVKKKGTNRTIVRTIRGRRKFGKQERRKNTRNIPIKPVRCLF